MAKILVFTIVEKVGYTSTVMENSLKLAEWIKDEIEKEYGIKKESMAEENLFGSWAMNGDGLYVQIVAENNEDLEKLPDDFGNHIQTREELKKWTESNNLKKLEADRLYYIESIYDEYLFEV